MGYGRRSTTSLNNSGEVSSTEKPTAIALRKSVVRGITYSASLSVSLPITLGCTHGFLSSRRSLSPTISKARIFRTPEEIVDIHPCNGERTHYHSPLLKTPTSCSSNLSHTLPVNRYVIQSHEAGGFCGGHRNSCLFCGQLAFVEIILKLPASPPTQLSDSCMSCLESRIQDMLLVRLQPPLL